MKDEGENIVAMARVGCDHLPSHWDTRASSPSFAIMAGAAAMVLESERRARRRTVMWTLVGLAVDVVLGAAVLWGAT